ncbi:hypothetical protein ACL9RL_07570 [Plantibacter sp. Mn2098]|uniref:hypothetical protein n=1 Tax=Plantibacter sp. Mn2098 TaxID=3395266 RepID=UPI003BE473B0
MEADAAALGLKRDEFLEIIATEWAEHGFMGVGAIPAMWRHDRAVFEIAAAGTGWWVDVEHPDTLSVLEAELTSVLAEQRVTTLTTAVLRGENRIITGAVAALVRGWTFDDGTSARGIHFGRKFGGGTCRAIWLPETELIGLSPEAIFVTDERLALAADRFRIRVF